MAQATIDHDKIRSWAKSKGAGQPASTAQAATATSA
jgi:hypothetical protein